MNSARRLFSFWAALRTLPATPFTCASGREVLRLAKRSALRNLSLQGGPCSAADQFALMLGQGRKDADGERIGIGHIDALKVNA
jgi:hypothetical protein